MSKNKLLYVHEDDAMERTAFRTKVASELGFAVMSIMNNEDFSPERESGILNLVADEELAGVWLDFNINEISPISKRLTLAAGDNEKRVLGRVPVSSTEEEIKQKLIIHIGLPTETESL